MKRFNKEDKSLFIRDSKEKNSHATQKIHSVKLIKKGERFKKEDKSRISKDSEKRTNHSY